MTRTAHRLLRVANVQIQNRYGEWVPAVPAPMYKWFWRECSCGAKFFRTQSYRGHFALKHILCLDYGEDNHR